MTITTNHIAEFSALAVSLAFWKNIKKGKLDILPFFLLFILLVELTGTPLREIKFPNYMLFIKNPNVILYNFTIPVEYLFYFWLFYRHGAGLLKLFSKISIVILLITMVASFKIPITLLHRNVLVTGQVCAIIGCCIYLYEQFQNPGDESLLNTYFFWIAAGLLLFNLGDLAYFILYPLIHKNNWDKHDLLFNTTNSGLLILLYFSYIIAIVVHKKYSVNNAG